MEQTNSLLQPGLVILYERLHLLLVDRYIGQIRVRLGSLALRRSHEPRKSSRALLTSQNSRHRPPRLTNPSHRIDMIKFHHTSRLLCMSLRVCGAYLF